MSANPPKNDAWPQPRRWRHCWVRFGQGNCPAAPAPGLILDWRREGRRWLAWVIWIDNTGRRDTVRQAWLPVSAIRPAKSDINVWNDGPWR
ncbi:MULTISPECIES: hypothetical protein [unclassified Nocardioides]|uniref:hypothetical protein n=1 Tax=unclassified Nocardioides TaxID=2615069 RepID=UPI0006FBD60E|nr:MULTISPECIES: hypothetical protein [unclassified Nocardioides]KRA30989.1 hypothetical protein ASD81_15945 [Nocardioides sp. Root614]KRA87610.1 hypothetical protein ASD84_16220 [Nocardioides sp. Root682]